MFARSRFFTYFWKIYSRQKLKQMSSQLMQAAKRAAHLAYAPYSGFAVGAAVLTQDGLMVAGNNQEVASYGLTICAERVALAKLFSDNPDAKISRIAVCALSDPEGKVRPCGACLEYIKECAKRSGIDIQVEMSDITLPISTLLPYPF